MFRLLVCFFVFSGAAHAQSLDDILDRARRYVAAYEEDFGTLIGEEEYVQTATWQAQSTGGSVIGSGRGGAAPSSAGRRQQRRLSSDFLLVRIGPTWYGVRNVLRVDGLRTEARENSFSAILAKSPDALAEQLDAIYVDNARYNIGDFQRTFNIPTFPLTILRDENFQRFVFEPGGDKEIDKVQVREVKFSEARRPTLVRGPSGEERFSHGSLWIDPASGRILKTEITVDGKTGSTSFKASMIVEYESSTKLGLLVPRTMQERYDTDSHYITCLATYSKFGRFEVTVDAKD